MVRRGLGAAVLTAAVGGCAPMLTTVVQPQAPGLRYGTNTGYRLTHHDFFRFSAEFATVLGDTFTVTLPRVLLNDRPWDLPPVRFMRVRRWIIMPFNC